MAELRHAVEELEDLLAGDFSDGAQEGAAVRYPASSGTTEGSLTNTARQPRGARF